MIISFFTVFAMRFLFCTSFTKDKFWNVNAYFLLFVFFFSVCSYSFLSRSFIFFLNVFAKKVILKVDLLQFYKNLLSSIPIDFDPNVAESILEWKSMTIYDFFGLFVRFYRTIKTTEQVQKWPSAFGKHSTISKLPQNFPNQVVS